MSERIYVVVMVGGAGTRLWPLSRRARPKMLLAVGGEESLLRRTVDRAAALAGDVGRVRLVTVSDCAEAVRAEVPEVPGANIIVEPMGRDTAACVCLGACLVRARDPEGIMVMMPADHLISPLDRCVATLRRAADRAATGAIVTIGVVPTRPETGYGYIERGEAVDPGGQVPAFRVNAFKEKPDRALAEQYLAHGGYYWNAGIFTWRAERLLGEVEQRLPGHARAFGEIGRAVGRADFERVLRAQYEDLERISIDYGVMEKADHVEVVEAGFEWDDLGSWTALAAHMAADADGNTVEAPERFLGEDVSDCIVLGGGGKLICALGVRGLVVVDTEDALFICARDRDQEVKRIVEKLKDQGREDLL